MPTCRYSWLGTVEYLRARQLQDELVNRVHDGLSPDTLLLLEHPHVYTRGRLSRDEHLLTADSELAALGVPVHETDRGGQVTYHGPGQLIGYPILNLRRLGIGPLQYVRTLEQVIVDTLADAAVAETSSARVPADAEVPERTSAPADSAAPETSSAPAQDAAHRHRVSQSSLPPVPLDHADRSQAAASPSDGSASAAPQQDSPIFDAASCSGAKQGDVLWDPGPLVPIDDPPPYEPLIDEPRSHLAVPPLAGEWHRSERPRSEGSRSEEHSAVRPGRAPADGFRSEEEAC